MGKFTGFLEESDLFNDLDPLHLDLIDPICEDQVFQKGEIIFQENSRQDELYLIINGSVEILVNPELVTAHLATPQRLEPIATLRIGQCFGEITLVDEGLRSATARAAKNNTRLLRIARSRLILLCDSYPELGYRLMKNLAVELGQKIRSSNLKAREEMLYRKSTAAPTNPK
jgi:CRP-like cAMP-binding protein